MLNKKTLHTFVPEMIKGDITFCQFRREQCRDYEVQIIEKIIDDVAITNGGYKIDVHTGIEQNKKFGPRIWSVLRQSNKEEYAKVVEYQKAKKWLKKISEFPELLISAYKTCSASIDSDQRSYFHDLDSDQYELLFTEKMESIVSSYKKPLWCGHPFALSGWFGCPKLLKKRNVNERVCQECSCFVNPKYGDYFKRLRLIAGVTAEQVGSFLKIKDYRDIEEGKRRAKSWEIEKLLNLYCVKDWYFVDILKMLYTPKEQRDFELDSIYRTIILNKLRKK